MQVKKKGVPLQSLSETGVLQEPRGTPKSRAEGTEKFIEKTESKKLPSPKQRRESGSSEGVQEQVPKNTIRTRASIPGDSSSGVP